MASKPSSKSSIRYWLYLALALTFSAACVWAADVIFTGHGWVDVVVCSGLITLNTLNIVLVIPQLLSLVVYGRDIPAINSFISGS